MVTFDEFLATVFSDVVEEQGGKRMYLYSTLTDINVSFLYHWLEDKRYSVAERSLYKLHQAYIKENKINMQHWAR